MIDDLVDIVLRQAPIGRERIAEHLGPCFNVLPNSPNLEVSLPHARDHPGPDPGTIWPVPLQKPHDGHLAHVGTTDALTPRLVHVAGLSADVRLVHLSPFILSNEPDASQVGYAGA